MQLIRWRPGRVGSLLGLGMLAITVVLPLSVAAVSNSISRTYKTSDTELVVGMAVSLTGDSASEQTRVQRTNPENGRRFVGIASQLDDNLVTLSSPSADVIVTTSGQVTGLVSDLNGTVKKGDVLISSPLAGVLMRADITVDEQQYPAIAVAVSDPSEVATKSVKDKAGREKQIKVSTLKVDLSTGISGQTNYGGKKRTFLVVVVNSITGKYVSEWQAISAFAVFLAIILTDSIIVYGTVRNAIVALGRNPLSRKSVTRQVVQVFMLAIGLFVIGCLAIFLILTF